MALRLRSRKHHVESRAKDGFKRAQDAKADFTAPKLPDVHIDLKDVRKEAQSRVSHGVSDMRSKFEDLLPDTVAEKTGIRRKKRARRMGWMVGGLALLGLGYWFYGMFKTNFARTHGGSLDTTNSETPGTTAPGQSTYGNLPVSQTTATPEVTNTETPGVGSGATNGGTARTAARPSTTTPVVKATAPQVKTEANVATAAIPGTDVLRHATALSSYDLPAMGALIGREMVDLNDHKVGEIEAVYYRSYEPKPEWAAVTVGMVDKKRALVPLDGATLGDPITVAYTKDMIEAAPPVEDEVIPEQLEMTLYGHYSARRMLPGIESQRTPESERLRAWTPEATKS
jgi:hypothetical protein